MSTLIDARTAFSRVRDLPPLPKVLMDLLAALQRDDVAIDQVAEHVARDQALAAKALRLANCSFYGVSGRVNSIRDAINVLGLRSLGAALTAAAVTNSIKAVNCPGFDLKAYWRHSIASGLCAQAIASYVDLDPALAFTGGLLHDIGRLALVAQVPAAMAPVFAFRLAQDIDPAAAERQTLGFDHADIGALVAAHWRFGPAVVDAIQWHHQPRAEARRTLADVVHVADNIVHALDLAGCVDDMVPPLAQDAWDRVGLAPAQCSDLFDRTTTELDELCEALSV